MISSLIPILFLLAPLEFPVRLLAFELDDFDELGEEAEFPLGGLLLPALLFFVLPLLPFELEDAEDPPGCFSFLSFIIVRAVCQNHLLNTVQFIRNR